MQQPESLLIASWRQHVVTGNLVDRALKTLLNAKQGFTQQTSKYVSWYNRHTSRASIQDNDKMAINNFRNSLRSDIRERLMTYYGQPENLPASSLKTIQTIATNFDTLDQEDQPNQIEQRDRDYIRQDCTTNNLDSNRPPTRFTTKLTPVLCRTCLSTNPNSTHVFSKIHFEEKHKNKQKLQNIKINHLDFQNSTSMEKVNLSTTLQDITDNIIAFEQYQLDQSENKNE
jgi:hypothetical protein